MFRKSVFENMETGFFSQEIPQEPEVRKDSWNSETWNTAKGFHG